MALARTGDRRALRRLLVAVSATIYRYGRSFCRDPHDAEDVLQDVLVTLLETLPTFRGEAALSTWAFVVARRTCARRRRRQERFRSLGSGEGLPARELADPNASPPRDLARRELRTALERAIRDLPEDQRDVFILRDVEGRGGSEVAKTLRLGERAMKSRLHRARLALRAALAPAAGRVAKPAARGPACADTARLISGYLEGDVDAAVCTRMRSHVEDCEVCANTCEGLREVLGACREWGKAPIPAEARAMMRVAITRVLDSLPE